MSFINDTVKMKGFRKMDFESLLQIKEDLWSYLAKTTKSIVIYGTGNGADKIIDVLNSRNINIYGIFASDGFVRDRTFRGFKVKHYSDFCNELDNFIVLVSFASQRDEVLEKIYKIDSEQELFAPDVPVYGTGLFDLQYFHDNVDKFKKVYSKLSDELSRKTYINTIAYKLTGKIAYLQDCETSKDEIYTLLDKSSKCKNYIDVGAYTGDTVEEYIKYFGSNMKLYAFEPDSKNYTKMLKRFENNNTVCETFNNPVWNTCEMISFDSLSGRSASASENSSKHVQSCMAVSLDSFNFEDIGIVKIDAEGSDANVLKGMANLISESVHCIKTAAYHRNEDYFNLPETVDLFNDEYDLYMRHLKYVPAWDTDYIFVFKNR